MKRELLQGYDKIPVVIGVTGHRDIFCGTADSPEDGAALKEQVRSAIAEIQALCGGGTPVIMLNGLAQGADMLCADVAEEAGVPLYAVLPCEKEKYVQSFDGENREKDVEHFHRLLGKCEKLIVAPDQERLGKRAREEKFDCQESYEYRQLGIYIAEHSHFLIALWDGEEPQSEYGCGTAEVVKFALTHDYLDSEHVPIPGTINDTAVVWIKSRRKKSGCNCATEEGCAGEMQRVYRIKDIEGFQADGGGELPYRDSAACPDGIKEIVRRTVRYNAETVFRREGAGDYLWGDGRGKSLPVADAGLDGLRSQYCKADSLADKYRRNYQRCMLLLAVLSVLFTLFFLLYDDGSLPWMIYPCLLGLVSAIALAVVCGARHLNYHRKYIEYRALAEVLRTQFYLCACGTKAFICDEFTWSQKCDMCWIEKAVRTLFVLRDFQKPLDKELIRKNWLEGQYAYHKSKLNPRKRSSHKRQAILNRRIKGVMFVFSILLYSVIFLLEILAAAGVAKFWEGALPGSAISWRNLGAMAVGLSAVVTLFLSLYYDNLSNERKVDDHEKMMKLYLYALRNWEEVSNDKLRFERFVRYVAREEIVENGIWYSYVNENGLQANT